MLFVALALFSLGHRFEHTPVVTSDELRLCGADLRLVARDDDIDLMAVGRPEIEVNHQGEIGVRGAAGAEHFNIVETRHALEHVEVNVVKAGLKERSATVLALNLRERVTTVRQQLAFGTECRGREIFPRTTVEREANRQRIQKHSDDTFAIGCFRTAVENHSRNNVTLAADRAQHSEVRAKQYALEGHTRAAC